MYLARQFAKHRSMRFRAQQQQQHGGCARRL
jgi:hypothetical protein